MKTLTNMSSDSDPVTTDQEIQKQEEISYGEVEGRIKYIQGKVLVLVEACIVDKGQLKAIKDMIKTIFSENLTSFYNHTHPNCTLLGEGDMYQFSGSVEKFYGDNQV